MITLLGILLPKWTIPDAVMSSYDYAILNLYGLDQLLPVHEILNVLFLIVLFELAAFTFKTVTWLITLVRGGGQPIEI